MRILTMLTFAFAAVLLAACGNGSRGVTQKFVFTPVPYTYLNEPDGTAIPWSVPPGATASVCYPYIADEVVALVAADHVDAFKAWLKTVGFTVRHEYTSTMGAHPTEFNVGVPVGSAKDAVALISSQPGVSRSNLDQPARLQESTQGPAICPASTAGS